MKPSVEVRAFSVIVAFVQKVQRAADAALADSGLSSAQFFILATVERGGEAQQSELAKALGVTAANVSQLVAKLDEAQLVTRVDRGKARVVSLTSRGRALVAQLKPEHDAFVESRFATLSAAERRTLLGLLERLVADHD